MNGIVLLVSMTAIGVDYGWQIGVDGEVEYIVQIEPSLLDSLKDGTEIASEIDPSIGNVRRFRIRVGTGALPRGTRQPADPTAQQPAVDAQAAPANAAPPRSTTESTSPEGQSVPVLNLPPPPKDLNTDGMASVLIREPAQQNQADERPAASTASPSAVSGSLKDLPPPPSLLTNPVPGNNREQAAVESTEPARQSDANQTSQDDPHPDEQPRSRPDWREPREPPSPDDNQDAPAHPIVTPEAQDKFPLPIRDPDNAATQPETPPGRLETPRVGLPQDDAVKRSFDTSNQSVVQQPPPADEQQESPADAEPLPEDDQFEDDRVNNLAALQKPTLDEQTREQLLKSENTKPWMPLVLTSLALFASLALNFYLGWIALGIYRKYRGLAVRLHQTQMA